MKMPKGEMRSQCPITNTLDLIGDRWTLIIIRDMLFLEKKLFNDFLESPEKIATNILTDRLKCLQSCEVIASRPHPKHKKKKIYYLTQKGKDLLPILVELILWGATYRATPDMPKARFNKIKRNPKKFMKSTLQGLKAWDKKNL